MKTFLLYFNYSRAYWFALITVLGGLLGGSWSFLGLAAVFIVHPFIDNVLLKHQRIPAERPNSNLTLLVIGMAFPFLCGFLGLGLWMALKSKSTLEFVGLVLSFGTIMGVLGINTAHELVHRSNRWLRILGRGILILVNFTHWEIEHVYGHHKNVGTPQDPATARKNEWIYFYYVRSYFGGLINSFLSEHRRLHKKDPSSVWSNRVAWLGLLQTAVSISIYFIYGLPGFLFWIGQSCVAILLLETVDYVEHYGLQRQRLPDGSFEPVRVQHSWDSYQAWTNFTLINLGFHSHHHQKASLPFTELREQPDAMVLPYGYSAMALMALLPPLYFYVMNPRLPSSSMSHEITPAPVSGRAV